MPKALIIGPDFYNFNEAVCAAFTASGYDTAVLKYGTPVDPYNTAARIRYKLATDKEAFRARNRGARQTYYAAAFDAVKPDVVFILNGEILATDTLEHFRRCGAKTALWCFDSVKHIPAVREHISHVDLFYCYDRGDIEFYAARGQQAFFLPQAADTSIYHPLEGVSKDIDILFVGDLYHSPRRQRYIAEVIKAFPERKIVVAGIYKPWYKNPLKALLRERRDIFTNRNLPPEAVNALYNRARVVLNIHNEQQSDGANPKVFEICAAGAYQICDTNPYLCTLFANGQLGLYSDAAGMISLIREALEGDMSARAAAASALVRERHTFEARMQTVINDLSKL
ncbi:MAG: glycosyltransferase [Bacteroidales bacterium]|nr:glycosyltransferase [Bacteroidales bacterium]